MVQILPPLLFSDLLFAHSLQAVGVGHSYRGNRKDRDRHARYNKTDSCAYDVFSRELTQVDRENQIARAEKHTEQRDRQYKRFFEREFAFHFLPAYIMRVYPDDTRLQQHHI